jgi:hypothetical protein
MANSLDVAVEEEPQRFGKYAFENNPNIKNLSDFRKALISAFNTDRGSHAEFSEQNIVRLFESRAVKDLIKENVSAEEYDKLYGDGYFVKREVVGKKIITITEPKISIHSHTRAGHKIKAYNKGYRRWTNVEIKFLQVRKARKLSPKKIIGEYNTHFKTNLRTSSSIKTKVFRI